MATEPPVYITFNETIVKSNLFVLGVAAINKPIKNIVVGHSALNKTIYDHICPVRTSATVKYKIPSISTAAIGFPEAIPVYKESRSDSKRPGFGWLTTFLPLSRKLLVECGSPIYFEDYYAEKELSWDTKDYLAEIVRKEVEKLLQNHVPQYVQRLPKGLTKT
ncbi:MAG: hypothetical protein ACFFCZ_26015, partial [Promethearchaeota archaeon]